MGDLFNKDKNRIVMKIIKISDTHYIGVEKSKINTGDWIYNPVLQSLFVQVAEKNFPIPYGLEWNFFIDSLNNNAETYKITHSSIPIEEGNQFHTIKHLTRPYS